MFEKQEECPRCGHDGPLWNYDGQRCASCKYPEMTLHEALQALNRAAYAAIRAGEDTTLHPYLDRQSLRKIALETDKLVDDNAPPIASA